MRAIAEVAPFAPNRFESKTNQKLKMLESVVMWLKGSVPGIIILGAAGSILAILILRMVRPILQLIRLPLGYHQRRRGKQAFVLGYSAAAISRDKTGNLLVSFLFFHTIVLMMLSTGLLVSFTVFSAIVLTQIETSLTIGTLVSSASGFTFLYYSYFEYEYVYRTYLFFWGKSLEKIDASYTKDPQN